MKRIYQLLFLTLTLFVLSACAVFPLVGGTRASGNLGGEWPEGSRLALVSLTDQGQLNYSNQTQIVDPNIFDGYVVALPEPAAESIYQIAGYNDLNQNSLFEENEVVATTGGKYLIYTRTDKQITFLGQTIVARRGWNGYDLQAENTLETPNPYQASTYGDYDLFLQ